MNIPKEMILNQLIRIPAVRAAAMKRHMTGISHFPERLDKDYASFTSHCTVKDKDLLELGPGKTVGMVLKARENGAASIAIADIKAYLTPEETAANGIDYRVYDGRNLPFPDSSFDLIWSTSVYEHLRFPETTVQETFRVLRPGGRVVHLIDLVDHFSLGMNNPHITFNCLKYKQSTWEWMTWHRSNYVNRLRYSDWIALHERMGFKVVETVNEESDYIRENYRSEPGLDYLRRYSETDAVSTSMHLVGEKG